MAETTGIAWTDSTFNPWIGCTKVGPGCDHCYAEALMDKRWHKVQWGSGQQRVRTSTSNWKLPLLWEREHEAFMLAHGRRRRVFCASLADVFDNEAPAAWRAELFVLIGLTPHLDWLLLTKRIGNVSKMLDQPGMPKAELPENIWLGITVVNQEEADRDIPKLALLPAAVRWLSMEPLLGAVDLAPHFGLWWEGAIAPVDWVIVGGESGLGARPIELPWIEAIRRQCTLFGVPFFFKQWGGASATAGGCALNGAELKAWPVAA